MNNIKILDCTLRDGGYCNKWKFGTDNTNAIIDGLVKSNIEIIECGFLTDTVKYEKGITKFTTVQEAAEFIPENRDNKLFVLLMNYGEYDVDCLPDFDGSSIDGIRVAFHKKDADNALKICSAIKQKGYKVFLQPMVSLNYTDNEFIELINKSNQIHPYAFYIVDSFGVMKRKDLIRLFYMVEHNLYNDIYIGYHSHNNLQLAYSNAQALSDVQSNRSIIIDSSIMGMGRGAGNLNTELFIDYLNDNKGKQYQLSPLLRIIDEILDNFYQQNYWGYTLPNYLSAKHNCHPDYASYLDSKKTLTVDNINDIFSLMDNEYKSHYDKDYIEKIYLEYMSSGKTNNIHYNEFSNIIKNKKVLLIAPGKSSETEKNKIIDFSKKCDVVISVNHDYKYVKTDYIFLSNFRRLKNISNAIRQKTIVTSNILDDDFYLKVAYSNLINNRESIKDNSGMMVIKLLIDLNADEIYLAGFDGYSYDINQNYSGDNMKMIMKNNIIDAMNYQMSKLLAEFSQKINIEFITEKKFITI